VALDIRLHEPSAPHEQAAEDTLEHAMLAWRTARAQIAAVAPDKLPREAQAAYYRMLTRIGLWVDARVAGADERGAELESDEDHAAADDAHDAHDDSGDAVAPASAHTVAVE